MDRPRQMLLLNKTIPEALRNGGLWNITEDIETCVLEEYCRINDIHYLQMTPFATKEESALMSIVLLLLQNIDRKLLSSNPISSLQDHIGLVDQVCEQPSRSLTSCIDFLYRSNNRKIIIHSQRSPAFPLVDEEMLLLHSALQQFRNRVIFLFALPSYKNVYVNELRNFNMDPIYISYSHSERCKRFIESVVNGCSSADINYSIDFKDLSYGDNIREYENMIGKGSRCIVIITEEYLHSPHCMYELTKILKARKAGRNKIFPLVDTGKYTRDSTGLDELRTFWKDQHKKTHGNANTPSTFTARELGDFAEILLCLDDLWEYLHDINTGDIDDLTQNNAEKLITEIKRDIHEEKLRQTKENLNINSDGLSRIDGDSPSQTFLNQYGDNSVSFAKVNGSITINQYRNN